MNNGSLEPRERSTPQTDSVDLDLHATIVPAGPVVSAFSSTGDGAPDVCPSPP